ncbi:MAG TPA: hypothetical protein VLV88_00030 [Terriglobales bacterium]|nr:hypothetical protein [Terriglobales bacterium]
MPPLPTGFFRTRARKIVAALLFAGLMFVVFLSILAHHAEPLLRARVIETLSTRFQSRVDLAALHVSVFNGLTVSGSGLKIYGQSDPNIHLPGVQPLIDVDRFSFRTAPIALLRVPMRIGNVHITGFTLNIPPKETRSELGRVASTRGKIKMIVDHFEAEKCNLVINTNRLDKLPLEFEIHDLDMTDVGEGRPLQFHASLANPKPLGEIASNGEFGPFNVQEPRDSPVHGHYTFSHADLGTLKGIAGILSSSGEYSGTLGNIVVDGVTDTPDFRLDLGGRGIPLQTTFHAIVDGTTGDTYLQPVHARLMTTPFTAIGKVVRSAYPAGHHIELDVTLTQGRIQDLLALAMRRPAPIMTGAVQLHTRLDLPPGEATVSNRLFLQGKFQISGVHFSSAAVQGKIDTLSLRSQGKPEMAKNEPAENIQSRMTGHFTLRNASLDLPDLVFQVPGTRVSLRGDYPLDGDDFEFHGNARFDARLSQMVTGWKSLLLKPLDHFFRKDGSGADIPIKISGTKADVHFGLDFGHKTKQRSARDQAEMISRENKQ